MKIRTPYPIFIFIFAFVIITGCTTNPARKATRDYPISPLTFTSVQLTDDFWLPRILKNTDITIPIAFSQSEETGRIKNFEVAGGLSPGTFCSIYPFDDSDVFKIMEGAAYSLMIKPDPELEAYLDTLIYKISLAQEPDGYLYTNRTILGDSAHEWAGTERWQHVNESSHELYNVGHMYEAAVAHFNATGKRTFLDIAIKNADLVYHDFGPGKIEKYPGHQEVEIGLVKLYRATGDDRYLELAKFFLDVRGPEGWEYNQAHQKVTNQREPVGHAVRALYMYSGMADVAALTGNPDYLLAIRAIWEEVVTKKMYVTGGIGQSGGNEGFGPDYDLPNMSAYCETCASIANVFWNHRMFLMTGNAKYIDVMERTMYNALLSGVSISGDRFFYPNPLESDGQHIRKAWFGCACCPSNISRFLPSIPGYVYAQTEGQLFVNLYISSNTVFNTSDCTITLNQATNYPWDGVVLIEVDPEKSTRQRINLRMPGWAVNQPVPGDLYSFYAINGQKPVIRINGEEFTYPVDKGYAVLDKTWVRGDLIEIIIPMPVRKVMANDSVTADRGRFAVQRGPLVYCIEEKDQDEKMVRHVVTDVDCGFQVKREVHLWGGINTIEFMGHNVSATVNGDYLEDKKPRTLRAVPYAFWANRGPGEMLVWIPYDPAYANPRPYPTLAYRSKKYAPGANGNLALLSDQYDPVNSNDHSVGYIHWWPEHDTTVEIVYDFEKPETVSSVSVYWFDDGPDGGCRIPESWEVFYMHEATWVPVVNKGPYSVTKDGYDKLDFEPVSTTGLRLQVKLQHDFSGGVHEWRVY